MLGGLLFALSVYFEADIVDYVSNVSSNSERTKEGEWNKMDEIHWRGVEGWQSDGDTIVI